MSEDTTPIISTLEIMGINIEQKTGLFDSYSHQSTDIVGAYQHVGDFEQVESGLKKLIELQIESLERLIERNKSRIIRDIEPEHAVIFFELILRVRRNDPNAFGISNLEKFEETIRLEEEHKQAQNERDIGKAANLARRIKVRFSQFNKDEYGEREIESGCFRLIRNNKEQRKLLIEFVKPKDIFSEMRRNGINIASLTKVPKEYEGYIEKNIQNSDKMRTLLQEEKKLHEIIKKWVIRYFRKSDISADIIRRIA